MHECLNVDVFACLHAGQERVRHRKKQRVGVWEGEVEGWEEGEGGQERVARKREIDKVKEQELEGGRMRD